MIAQRRSLVVGGTRGIGSAIAGVLARAGHLVAAFGHSDPSSPLAGVNYFRGDLGDPVGCLAVLDQIELAMGTPHDLVFAQRLREEGDDWTREWEVAVLGTRRVIDHWVNRLGPGASIVVIGSMASRLVTRSLPVRYHLAKAAIGQMVRCYAVSLGSQGIRVNAVTPGTVVKPENREHYADAGDRYAAIAEATPLGRMGTADEVGTVVQFLCSPLASFVTGQDIVVDGGASLVLPDAFAAQNEGR